MRIKTDEAPRMARNARADGVHRPGYDSILPPEVRDELLNVKPPQPSIPPKLPPATPGRALRAAIGYGLLIGLPVFGLIALISLSNSWHRSPAVRASVARVATPPPPQVLSTPPPPAVRVLRAEPVEPTVLRATLVSVPVGTSGAIIMPCDGQAVTVVYRGEIPSFGDLPRDPQLGDMYKVTEGRQQEWVWYQLANFANPAWVDPDLGDFSWEHGQ